MRQAGRVELGPIAVRIEHIGSTSVPGLAAKPIIDIQVSVPDIEDEDAYVPSLAAEGYLLRVRQAGHRMVRTADLGTQVHLCQVDSARERRHLLFRDWLRHDDADRALYLRTKQELASREWPDMNAYADAKGPVIVAITERAEAWAERSGWAPD